jgi:hypothetical protein
MAASVAKTNSDGYFPCVKTPEEAFCAVSSNSVEDLVARFKAAVTTADANVLRCDQENVIRRTAIWLQVDRRHVENYNYELLMI